MHLGSKSFGAAAAAEAAAAEAAAAVKEAAATQTVSRGRKATKSTIYTYWPAIWGAKT